MKFPELYSFWSRPWKECEMCCFGLNLLYVGDDYRVGLGLLFFEVGIRFKGKNPISEGVKVKLNYPEPHTIKTLFWAAPGVGVITYCNDEGDVVQRVTMDDGLTWGEGKIVINREAIKEARLGFEREVDNNAEEKI